MVEPMTNKNKFFLRFASFSSESEFSGRDAAEAYKQETTKQKTSLQKSQKYFVSTFFK
jgi:hypothetical protein